METVGTKRDLYWLMPIMAVEDGVVISKRGEVTVGWELSLPVVYGLTEEGYDEVVNAFVNAAVLLPPWTMIHRQDVFTYDRWKGEYDGRYLSDCFNAHFEGRRFLAHRQFLYLTMSTKGSALKANSQTAAFGIRFSAGFPDQEAMRTFLNKAEEFITVLTGCPYVKARPLASEDYEGVGIEPGLVDSYMSVWQDGPLRSDYVLSPEKVRMFDKTLLGFKISEAEVMNFGEVSDVAHVGDGSSVYDLCLSFGSALGVRLDCEHVVNQYILIPNQQDVLRDLDRKKKRMTSGRKQAENRVNADDISGFIDAVHRDGLTTCFHHMNVLAWCELGQELDVKGRISSALSTMGINATQSLNDLPSLFFAGVPGGACEIGKDNLMLQELTSMVCMGLNETFERDVPGGLVQVSDRMRNVPLRIDLGRRARALRYIDNYNVFLLGPSGSGKSFFTNYLLQQCYDAGEHIFVIDVGDSYEGLCQIVNETSGGRDGIYMTWDVDHPFSFNPFIGYETWLDRQGNIRQDESGVTFFISFLTTAWKPESGWRSENLSILERILGDFVQWALVNVPAGELPVFNDFFLFLVNEIAPRIMPVLDEQGNVVRLPADPYIVGKLPVRPGDFDVGRFIRSLSSYSSEGSYAFLLNDRHPKDLFASRFTVFEVRKLSEGNPLFYSLCVLCIMNAFDLKMRNASGFKRMVVDEAWKAIANETMAPYLREIWKTSRKHSCSAMVVTQELDDVISSEVIKEAILTNSDIKILLNQEKNANRFGQLESLLGLGEHQKNLILSMGHAHNPAYFYTDVYIGMNNRYNVYAIEASKQQALAFESEKEKKAPLLERARELGSIRDAIDDWVRRGITFDDFKNKVE